MKATNVSETQKKRRSPERSVNLAGIVTPAQMLPSRCFFCLRNPCLGLWLCLCKLHVRSSVILEHAHIQWNPFLTLVFLLDVGALWKPFWNAEQLLSYLTFNTFHSTKYLFHRHLHVLWSSKAKIPNEIPIQWMSQTYFIVHFNAPVFRYPTVLFWVVVVWLKSL